MQEMFEALVLNDIPLPQDIKVNKYITNHIDQLTKKELEDITTVFRSMETGLREATIYPKDLHRALKMLGLNPTDQEVVDMPNYIAKYSEELVQYIQSLSF